MFRISKVFIIFFLLCGIGVALFFYVLPEKEDPFVRPPQADLKTLTGEVFPFSVSVATSATHRLEKNNKLVSYLASEIAPLSEFEGQEVEIDGFFKKEKMREIFWVEAVRLMDTETEQTIPKKTEERFITKKFTFLFPVNWEYSLSPDGVAYFLDKNDPARRVFLTFGVRDLSKADLKKDPNVLIANLAGKKDIYTDEFDRERQLITLFSNLYEQKYEFIFTNNYEEFEKKKAFFKLLNSFQEGEENVLNAKKEDMKKQAEEEASKIKVVPEEAPIEKEELSTESSEDSSEEVDKEDSKSSTSEPIEEPIVSEPEESIIQAKEDLSVSEEAVSSSFKVPAFIDIIDQRAFKYANEYLKLSIKFPYGFWYRNFGEGDNSLTRLGAAQNPINTEADVQIWIEIVAVKNPPKQVTERQESDQLFVNWPRNDESFFKATGPVDKRNAILSILNSIR